MFQFEFSMLRYTFNKLNCRSPRKLFTGICLVILLLFFWRPAIFWSVFYEDTKAKGGTCLPDAMFDNFYKEVDLFNGRMSCYNPYGEDNGLFFVGNGYFGFLLLEEGTIYLKSGKILSLPVPYNPTVDIKTPELLKESSMIHYVDGIVYKDHCYSNGLHVIHEYFAHRTLPSILVQNIKVRNTQTLELKLDVLRRDYSKWSGAVSRTVKLEKVDNSPEIECSIISGLVYDPSLSSDEVLMVSIATEIIPEEINVDSLGEYNIQVITSIEYAIFSKSEYLKERPELENKASTKLKSALRKHNGILRKDHINMWQKLWNTGLSVSYSKALNSLNGNIINATMYYVLSSERVLSSEEDASEETKRYVTQRLAYAEGCYGSNHHTLEASDLWGNLTTLQNMNRVISLWLLTLEKQGCHELIKAGAEGVVQAMVLSFGSFRFNKQHLEFNMHPSFLHRDYRFRRINYGNNTQVNVTIHVQDNNKAVILVDLDKSDKTYYACDGGCLDEPIELGSKTVSFPVKLTNPFSATLYITHDKQHMEDLRRTLHLKNVDEAPAHEHTVIVLHKHGHHLGGLPTFFWASVIILIIIFHLFLIKLIYNECGLNDKGRPRYSNNPKNNMKYAFLS